MNTKNKTGIAPSRRVAIKIAVISLLGAIGLPLVNQGRIKEATETERADWEALRFCAAQVGEARERGDEKAMIKWQYRYDAAWQAWHGDWNFRGELINLARR